jgi:Zn-dependent protease
MDFDLTNWLRIASLAAVPIVLAITLHEAAHGYVAKLFGDSTAYLLGRVSLNPVRHIDPVGTIALPLLSLAMGGVLFGWAKPVPVDFGKLNHPKRDMLWVAAAGPAANLAMILFWALMIKLALVMPGNSYAEPMAKMGSFGVQINAALMVLNLIPLPPLDGGRIAVSLLPHDLALPLARVEPYGLIVLVVLLFSGLLGRLINPLIDATMHGVGAIVGIS